MTGTQKESVSVQAYHGTSEKAMCSPGFPSPRT